MDQHLVPVGAHLFGEGVCLACSGQDRKCQGLRYGAEVRGDGVVLSEVVDDNGNVAGAAALGDRSEAKNGRLHLAEAAADFDLIPPLGGAEDLAAEPLDKARDAQVGLSQGQVGGDANFDLVEILSAALGIECWPDAQIGQGAVDARVERVG